MAGFKATNFIGAFPMVGPRAGQDNAALVASNCKLEPGSISGLPGLATVQTVSAVKVYRIPTGSDATDWASSFWMQFGDADTDVVRTLVVNDSFERYYWASPSGGFHYSTKAQILASGSPLTVGVTPPVLGSFTVHTVVGTGGAGTPPVTVTRAYTATFVSIYGEESAPCLPTSGTGYADADWLLQSIPQPVVVAGAVTINLIRIYRSVQASDGSSIYYKVVDLATGTTTYTDRASDATISAGNQIPSTTWTPPPSNLQGLIAMPNGIMAGWVGSTVYFCEPFQPHSWPSSYQLQVQEPVVGLGVFGSTLVVCTTGRPVQITGIKPSTMAMSTNNVALPCLARRSIVSTPDGVYYASDNGIILIGPGGIINVTEKFIGRTDWNNTYLPKQLMGVYMAGVYMALRSNGTGFQVRPSGLDLGITDLTVGNSVSQVGVDVWSGRSWILLGTTNLSEFLKVDANPLQYTWTSKEFTLPAPVNIGVAQVMFDAPTYDLGATAAVHLDVYAYQRGEDLTGASSTIKVLVASFDVDQNERIIRLPHTLRSDVWQFILTGNTKVHQVALATSVAELKNV